MFFGHLMQTLWMSACLHMLLRHTALSQPRLLLKIDKQVWEALRKAIYRMPKASRVCD